MATAVTPSGHPLTAFLTMCDCYKTSSITMPQVVFIALLDIPSQSST